MGLPRIDLPLICGEARRSSQLPRRGRVCAAQIFPVVAGNRLVMFGHGPRGGMVDAGDLKSLAFGRAGSSPARGT